MGPVTVTVGVIGHLDSKQGTETVTSFCIIHSGIGPHAVCNGQLSIVSSAAGHSEDFTHALRLSVFATVVVAV
jgi:hypothetical protein